MKKILAMLFVSAMIAGSSFAQQAPQKARHKKAHTEKQDGKYKQSRLSPEERAARRTEKMTQELGLNKAQAKKLQALHLKQVAHRKEMHALQKERHAENREQRKEEMKAAHQQWQADLKDILTEKQYTQYQQQHEEMRTQHKAGHGREGNRYNGSR